MSLTYEAMNDVAVLVIVHLFFLLCTVRCSTLREGKPCATERVEIRCNSLTVVFATSLSVQAADSVQRIGVYRAACFATTGRARDPCVPSRQTSLCQCRRDFTKY